MPASSSAAPFGFGGYRFHWSEPEKKIARRAFERALNSEFKELMAETKRRASQIKQVTDVWDLGEFIDRCQKRIDDQYDYRYSVLPNVLAALMKAGRLTERDLEGLEKDKLAEIRRLEDIFSKSR